MVKQANFLQISVYKCQTQSFKKIQSDILHCSFLFSENMQVSSQLSGRVLEGEGGDREEEERGGGEGEGEGEGEREGEGHGVGAYHQHVYRPGSCY